MVVRDQQEKKNFWTFEPSGICLGTDVEKLPTGDYLLRGHEKGLVIERKGKLAEFATNISQPRFERELVRLEEFTHPFIILEFSMDELVRYPYSTDIPSYKWSKLRANWKYIMKRMIQLQLKYKTKIIFAGKNGKVIAEELFKEYLNGQ